MAEALQIVRLARGGPADDPLLADAVAHVLRPSFTSAELPDGSVLVDGAGRLAGDVLVATRGDVVVGAAVSSAPDDAGIVLLEYLAVRPGLRSSGVGGRLMAALRELWTDDGVALALGEVHDPRAHEETDDEKPRARLAFYERHGGWVLDAPWVQPSLAPGSPRVPGMLLVRLDLPPGAPRPGPVPSAPLVRWADAYFAAEGADDRDDPTRRALLDRLGAAPTVACLPLADHAAVRPLDS